MPTNSVPRHSAVVEAAIDLLELVAGFGRGITTAANIVRDLLHDLNEPARRDDA